jgi:hypothetical protein
VTRETCAGRAYLDLKAEARAESRVTREPIQRYVLGASWRFWPVLTT